MKRTKLIKLTKRTKRTKRNRKTRRRHRQRGGDGTASWTPQTDRLGDPDAIAQVTSVEKYEKDIKNKLTNSA